jgi:hypothetical protein
VRKATLSFMVIVAFVVSPAVSAAGSTAMDDPTGIWEIGQGLHGSPVSCTFTANVPGGFEHSEVQGIGRLDCSRSFQAIYAQVCLEVKDGAWAEAACSDVKIKPNSSSVQTSITVPCVPSTFDYWRAVVYGGADDANQTRAAGYLVGNKTGVTCRDIQTGAGSS